MSLHTCLTIGCITGNRLSAAFVLDICDIKGNQKNDHFLVPYPAPRPLSQETLYYLQAKGAFDKPDISFVASAFRTYFRYVHPLLPILNPADILLPLERGELGTKVLLLWSALFAAADVSTVLNLARMKLHSDPFLVC